MGKQKRARPLVTGFLERISSKIFSEYPRELSGLIGQQHGVYALYKKDKLYYIGLASNLRSRVKQHLSDRHAGKWDRFSLYLVRKADHIKELESLVLRISNPHGNAAIGKLPVAKALRRELSNRIKAAQSHEIDTLLSSRRRQRQPHRKRNRISRLHRVTRRAVLSQYATKGFALQATANGHAAKARVLRNGMISWNGNRYNSPSIAARAVLGRKQNGWEFWRFRSASGEWIMLDALRKRAGSLKIPK